MRSRCVARYWSWKQIWKLSKRGSFSAGACPKHLGYSPLCSLNQLQFAFTHGGGVLSPVVRRMQLLQSPLPSNASLSMIHPLRWDPEVVGENPASPSDWRPLEGFPCRWNNPVFVVTLTRGQVAMISLCNILESAFWQIRKLEDLHPPFPARRFLGPSLSSCIQSFSVPFLSKMKLIAMVQNLSAHAWSHPTLRAR